MMVPSPSPVDAADAIRLRVLRLGAGVQSTTPALMAAHGEVGPWPTAPSPAGSRARLRPPGLADVAQRAALPCLRVEAPRPARRPAAGGRGQALSVDFRLYAESSGATSIIRRQFTTDYKITPVHWKGRELAGLTRRRSPKHAVVKQ